MWLLPHQLQLDVAARENSSHVHHQEQSEMLENSMLSWFTDFRPIKKISRRQSNTAIPELIIEEKDANKRHEIVLQKKVVSKQSIEF